MNETSTAAADHHAAAEPDGSTPPDSMPVAHVAPEYPSADAGGAPDLPAEAGAVIEDLPAEAGDVTEDEDSQPVMADAAEPAPPVFSDLGLSEPILRAIVEMGYVHPTPIQAQAIPVVLMGRDVLGVAQTGTGKTASFTLPMMDILAGRRARARMPRSLILEPTRELALQVAENFVQYGKYLKLNHALLIGGESMNDQKDALNKGVDVLIATPGRLIDLFERGGLLLTDTRLLVIDEADRMLDMGFIPDVERIVSMLAPTRQTLFFSATMAPEIRRLADAFLQNPKLITVSRPASVATTITMGLAVVGEEEKREALRQLLRTEPVQNALIFCNRKRDVDILFKSLGKHGFNVGSLHGDMAQSARFATLEKFKANELQLLVCSDVAARGIDIGGLSHVFNFDVPIHAEDFVHRIGRTGRAGREGKAFTIATPYDRLAVEAIEKLTGHPLPRIDVPGVETAEFVEGEGRRGRGRGGKPGEKRGDKPERGEKHARGDKPGRGDKHGRGDKPAREEQAAPVEAVVAVEAEVAVATQAPQPRREGHREEGRRDGRRDGRNRDDRGRDDRGREARPRDDKPREERARDDRPRDDRPRDDRPRDDRPRDDRPRDDRGRDGRRRRDDDLGPSVLGFGDDVPAFMLIRSRHAYRAAHGGHEDVMETDDQADNTSMQDDGPFEGDSQE